MDGGSLFHLQHWKRKMTDTAAYIFSPRGLGLTGVGFRERLVAKKIVNECRIHFQNWISESAHSVCFISFGFSDSNCVHVSAIYCYCKSCLIGGDGNWFCSDTFYGTAEPLNVIGGWQEWGGVFLSNHFLLEE